MPTKKAKSKAQSAKRRITNASVEEQIAFLESQIALLKDQTSGTRLRASEFRLRKEASNAKPKSGGHGVTALPEVRSPKPEALPNNTATFLQTWLEEQHIMFKNFAELVPQLESTELNSADRRRLNGSGVRRYGFIEKTADVAGEFPQIWPGLVDDNGKLKELVGEIEVLRNLFVWFRYLSRVVQDLLLLAGDDAFRLAGAYYTAARDGARRKNPEAQQVFDMLRLFWRRPRRTSTEPTERELRRDFKRLIHGKADGDIFAKHESPHVSGGVHEVIDNVHSTKCRVKETPTP